MMNLNGPRESSDYFRDAACFFKTFSASFMAIDSVNNLQASLPPMK